MIVVTIVTRKWLEQASMQSSHRDWCCEDCLKRIPAGTRFLFSPVYLQAIGQCCITYVEIMMKRKLNDVSDTRVEQVCSNAWLLNSKRIVNKFETYCQACKTQQPIGSKILWNVILKESIGTCCLEEALALVDTRIADSAIRLIIKSEKKFPTIRCIITPGKNKRVEVAYNQLTLF